MRDEQYVADMRTAAKKLWDAVNELKAGQRQWNALDYGSTLQPDGYTAAEIGAVVFDTANAFENVLNAGHATNVAKLL